MRLELPNPGSPGGLFDAQPRGRQMLAAGCESHADCFSAQVQVNLIELASIERQPQSKRRNVYAAAEGVARKHPNGFVIDTQVSTECLPSENRMMDDVGCCIPGVTEQIWTVVARKCIRA